VLADEPTGNLDSHTSVEIMSVFQDLNDQGITILIVTHEPDIAAYAPRVITMKDGHVMSDVRSEPHSAQADLEREVAAAAPAQVAP
jgi:putative ABC transport system ATP-binding protein